MFSTLYHVYFWLSENLLYLQMNSRFLIAAQTHLLNLSTFFISCYTCSGGLLHACTFSTALAQLRRSTVISLLPWHGIHVFMQQVKKHSEG